MTTLPYFLADTYAAQTYEVVAALLIIIFSTVVIYFLARNVLKELRSHNHDKKMMRQKESEDLLNDSKIISQTPSVSKNSKDILSLINQSIEHSKQGQTMSVMFYMNLDNFSYVSDQYNKKQIDKAISEIEKRIKKSCTKGTIAGHLKDDIFVIYYTGEVNNNIISTKANEVLQIVREPLKSIPETLTTSMGIVLFPFDGISVSTLVKNAEIALYVSKKQGKNRYSLYSEDLIEKEQFNLSYYQEIKKSISREEFLLYYQPIVDIKTGRMIGMESLLRWKHPTMGILPPGKFLNVMDLTGDITWFGKWGFEKIVSQYVHWKKQYKVRDLFISTNLSPKQLVMPGLADEFFEIVKKYDFSAESFCLEIIDYYAIIKDPIALQNLSEFRRYGFRIAIDDLGDQFEILEDMTRVKANILKISREDVNKIMNGFQESEQIIKAIQLAFQNQKIVIAEGVENEAMLKRMSEFDIRFMQGYFFSQPKSVEETERIFANNPWSVDEFNRITR